MIELNAETIGAVCTAVGFIVGQITKRERRLTKIETTLKMVVNDLDNIALILGTKRALAEKKKKDEEEGIEDE